jgi:hypothetical protein
MKSPGSRQGFDFTADDDILLRIAARSGQRVQGGSRWAILSHKVEFPIGTDLQLTFGSGQYGSARIMRPPPWLTLNR